MWIHVFLNEINTNKEREYLSDLTLLTMPELDKVREPMLNAYV